MVNVAKAIKKDLENMRHKRLTHEQLLELIVDVAYEQASRECSGGYWFEGFLSKINDMQNPTRPERNV